MYKIITIENITIVFLKTRGQKWTWEIQCQQNMRNKIIYAKIPRGDLKSGSYQASWLYEFCPGRPPKANHRHLH